MTFRVKYVLTLEGYLDVEADSQDDAVQTVEGDTPLADLVAEVDLSRQSHGCLFVDEIEELPE